MKQHFIDEQAKEMFSMLVKREGVTKKQKSDGKPKVNFILRFLYEADTPSVYNKIRIKSFALRQEDSQNA